MSQIMCDYNQLIATSNSLMVYVKLFGVTVLVLALAPSSV